MKILKYFLLLGLMISGAEALADQNLSVAFKACFNGRANKRGVDGSSNTTVGVSCSGSLAQDLYDAAFSQSQEFGPSIWSDGNRIIARRFGDSKDVTSSCYRKIQDNTGRSTEMYWCNIEIDLRKSLIKALNLTSPGVTPPDELSDAFQDCMNSKVKKIQRDDPNYFSLDVKCENNAPRLFRALGSLAGITQELSEDAQGHVTTKTTKRYFGDQYNPSQCYQEVVVVSGNPSAQVSYGCFIKIDITQNFIQALDL